MLLCGAERRRRVAARRRSGSVQAPGGTLSRAPDFFEVGGFEMLPPEVVAKLELPSLGLAMPGGTDWVTGN